MKTVRPTTVLGSETVDFLMSGGASILLFAVMMVAVQRTTPDNSTSWFIYYLSFVVNFPHFLASYQLLYYDFREKIKKDFKMIWAAVIVPVILAVTLFVGFKSDANLLGHLVQLMYFTVGWHYVKQILGVMIVLNARKNIFFNSTERGWLKTHLFTIWAWSFVNSNVGAQSYGLEGITYPSLGLPHITWSVAAAAVTISGGMTAYQFLQKYVREGRISTPAALGTLGALYCWYLPALYHPAFFLMVPFFHSLQYLLFVLAYKRNEVAVKIGWPRDTESRAQWIKSYLGYIAVFVATGATFMHFLPRVFDKIEFLNLSSTSASSWVFASTIFINIHHYFIDNVLWRAHHPEMQNYLFKPQLPAQDGDQVAKKAA